MKKMLTACVLAFMVACGSNWIVPEAPPGGGPTVVEPTDPGDPDAGCPIEVPGDTDAGNPEEDGGSPEVDAGDPETDAGTPDVDAGTPETDAGTPEVDAGTPPEDGGNDKVCICHIPKGKPSNAHTICIGEPALSAHLKHGDYLGSCVEAP